MEKKKKYLIDDKEYSLEISETKPNNFYIKINNLKKHVKLIKFEQANNVLFFEINQIIYKIRIDDSKKTQLISHNFNSNKTINIKTQSKKQFFPAKPTKPSLSSKFKTELRSPIAGKIVKINVSEKNQIKKNQPLVIIESMKMENEILAENDSFVKTIQIGESDLVKQNQIIMTFEERENNAKTKNSNEEKKISNRRIGKKIKT